MRKTFDRRVVPDFALDFVRACQRRIPCHLGGGAALAGAYLGHRMTGGIDLFIAERRIPSIEKLPELLQGWWERWGKLVLAPPSHFRDANGRSVPDATL